jgi:hypothetical protein
MREMHGFRTKRRHRASDKAGPRGLGTVIG